MGSDFVSNSVLAECLLISILRRWAQISYREMFTLNVCFIFAILRRWAQISYRTRFTLSACFIFVNKWDCAPVTYFFFCGKTCAVYWRPLQYSYPVLVPTPVIFLSVCAKSSLSSPVLLGGISSPLPPLERGKCKKILIGRVKCFDRKGKRRWEEFLSSK